MTGFIELTQIKKKLDAKGFEFIGYTENPIVLNVGLIEAFYPIEIEGCPAKACIDFIRHWNDLRVKESFSEIKEAIAKAVTDK